MRSPRRSILPGFGIPLSLAFLMSSVALSGCKKDEDSSDKSEESSEAEKSDDKGEEKKDEAKKEAEPEKVVQAEPEPIPVEPLHTGLDLMLSFVPAEATEYVIVRDPTVLQEYAEEAARFLDGPLGRLAADPMGDPKSIEEQRKNLEEMKKTAKAVEEAVAASGLQLKEGIALVQLDKKKSLVVFAAEDVGALASLDKALKEAKVDGFSKTHDKCKAIDGAEGWNVCADDQAHVPAPPHFWRRPLLALAA